LNRGKATKEIDTIDRTAEEFSKEVEIGESKVIDVRKDTEYSAEHVEEAFSKPLASINDWIKISILKNRFSALCRIPQYDCCFDTSGSWFQKFQRN
jgi:rhodanese-related sulfurtransferase